MEKRSGTEREMHFWIEGKEVSAEQFWAAVKAMGGRATIDAVERRAPAYRPTPAGEREARR